MLALAAQSILMLFVASFFFSILASLPVLVISLLVLGTLFVMLGMLIGYSMPKEFQAILVAVTLATVLLFVSDFIVPLDVLPDTLAMLAGLNPVVLGGDVVRIALLFSGVGLSALTVDILTLLSYSAFVAILVVIVFRITKKSTIRSYVASMLKSPRRGKKGF